MPRSLLECAALPMPPALERDLVEALTTNPLAVASRGVA
jgi:hypothetical protein